MSSAIEVLKDKLSDARYFTCMDNPEEEDEDILAFKEAIVALEQKERIKEWLNKNIRLNKQIQPLVKSHDGELLYEIQIGIMEKVLELMK